MNELTGAVALAQLRKLEGILAALRERKDLLWSLIEDVEGVTARRLNDTDGECATFLTSIFDDPAHAASTAAAPVSKRLARPGGTITVTWTMSRPLHHRKRMVLAVTIRPARRPPLRTDDLLSQLSQHRSWSHRQRPRVGVRHHGALLTGRDRTRRPRRFSDAMRLGRSPRTKLV